MEKVKRTKVLTSNKNTQFKICFKIIGEENSSCFVCTMNSLFNNVYIVLTSSLYL